ncbi:DNA excision repair protein ERCC-8-like [Thrips palmi]|uniref:DNA excision repair protein ERCC-8-like n=1 Tax=Thrips palmi TaxID=161013 RepID=A0A6P9A3E6_THRPL|nr:DNA excision repair protein ERCC-8-like [Thrips palmi]XP_034252373.1 DNA excision repair protein ERCC-8-like [Thrips palmi]XP_034252374.1 DNA excision repair protein ERCC-8-like [Thrips palmi]XP_034252375.1 DNA excision repair protein ERCC-8-like [Thrips palmi]
MIRQLEKIRIGAIEHLEFMAEECGRRARNLTLSNYRDVENIHTSGVLSLDLDVDGRYLLSGCSDGSIYIHDLYNFTGTPSFTASAEHIIERTHKFAHKFSTECVQWYPRDSGLFVTASMDKTIQVWDSNYMRPVEKVKFEGRIFQIHMSTNTGSKCLIAVAGTESIVRLVDLKSGSYSHELRGHESAVLTCRWSPNQEYLLVTGGCDGRIILWDARSANTALRILDQNNGQVTYNNKFKLKSHDGAVNGLCFTENGLYLISLGWDAKAKLWNMTSGKRETVEYGSVPSEKRKSIQFDVSGSSSKEIVYIPSDGKILVYEVQSGQLVKTLQGHYNQVNSCKYNTLYQELYSAANDRSILIWTPDVLQEAAYKESLNTQRTYSKGTSRPSNEVTHDVWSSDED